MHKGSAEPCWTAEKISLDYVIKQGEVIVYLSGRWETWFPMALLGKPGGEGAYIIYIRQNMDSGQARTPSLPAPGGKNEKIVRPALQWRENRRGIKVRERFQSLSGGECYGDRSAGEKTRRRCAVDGGENHRKLFERVGHKTKRSKAGPSGGRYGSPAAGPCVRKSRERKNC